MNTKITLSDKTCNFLTRGARVKGYCFNCGRPFFDVPYATGIDKRGECVYCRESELRGAEKARQILGRTYKNILSERELKRRMRGNIKEDIRLIHILFGNMTFSGAICKANRLVDRR